MIKVGRFFLYVSSFHLVLNPGGRGNSRPLVMITNGV
jgi:hypothetical protein